MYKFLGTYHVIPALPKNLEPLREIAYNLYWAWYNDARELFIRLDRDLWLETNHNPVRMLGNISQERLLEASGDDGFKAHLNRVYENLQVYLNEKTWYTKKFKSKSKSSNIIYFSAEYGLTECLQTYSGGLGVLAGDHLKASSDLGIPLIGIGLLYKVGYFQQYLNSDGWQLERYEINDFDNLPMQLVYKDNEPLTLSVAMAEREVFFRVWKIQVGRVPLYLLDTNIQQNSETDRKITETLYGGNSETRIQQEIILGIGGIRAMKALGIQPMVCHMNEGHSAFLSLERMRILINELGLSFKEAKEVGFYSNIFTTHTPVPAGIDVFTNELVEEYLGGYYKNDLKISGKEFFALGSIYKGKESSVFNMAHLAMNTAGYVNGVSKLHSKVSRKMWVSGFPLVPFNEIPIGYVTNGVHIRSHISREMEDLFVRYLGTKWIENPTNETVWERVDNIPDQELWRTHEKRRERLVAFARERLRRQIKRRGGSQAELAAASEVLDPDVLTIGFARRFATYKRATLIFKNIDRIAKILNNTDMPIQIIIAGKAHPKDDEGKRFIQEMTEVSREERFKRKVVFIENYDLNVASYLVEGCDIWLNNPRRPLEASGTSGMKVIANGGLNLSVLDGWWDEGFDPEVGWKIGNGEEYSDPEYQDEVESSQLYDTLETNIAPLFYTPGEDNLPRAWISMIKNSMKKLGPFFNTQRMVKEYYNNYYNPSQEKRAMLLEDEGIKVKELSLWKEKVKKNWSKIKLLKIETNGTPTLIHVGDKFPIKAKIDLGDLKPEDVEVQIYYGPIDKQDDPTHSRTLVMKTQDQNENGHYDYFGNIIPSNSGQKGFTVRVLPRNDLLINAFELGVVYWADLDQE